MHSPQSSLFRATKAFRVRWSKRRCEAETKIFKSETSYTVVDKTSVSHFMVKNTSLKETDGKEKFKRMLSFLKFSGQRKAFLYKIVLRGIRNFHDGRSERVACFERHQAAKFRRVFWYISRYSIVKKITGSSNVGESYGIFTVRFSTWAIFDTQPANEFYLKVCFF